MTTVFDLVLGKLVTQPRLVQLSVGDYAPIRSAYVMEVAGILGEYLLTENARITRFKNQFKRSITANFDLAFAQGFTDGGGGAYPDDAAPGDIQWLAAKINAEYGYVDLLFEQLRSLKEEGPDAWAGEPERRAEGYAKTLDGIYSEAKLRGGKDVMLIMDGNDGAENCSTCKKWKGKIHKASWWIKRGLVPGQPGNPSYECHGWNCQHRLYNAKTGELWTV